MDNKDHLITLDDPDINNLESQLDSWRAGALNTLLMVAVLVFLPALIVWFLRFDFLQLSATKVYLTIYLVIAGLAFFRQIDYRLRAWVLVTLTYLTGTLALVLGGLAGDGRVYLLVVPIIALILIGKRASVLTFALSLITFSVLGVVASRGWLTDRLLTLENPVHWTNWVQAGIVLAACLSMVAALQWKFSQFLETTALKNARLYEKIRSIAAELEQRVDERTAELQNAYETPRAR